MLVLIVWAGAIALFFNRWGKIRMLLPYQPDYKQEQLKVPGTGVCANGTCNGQHSHQVGPSSFTRFSSPNHQKLPPNYHHHHHHYQHQYFLQAYTVRRRREWPRSRVECGCCDVRVASSASRSLPSSTSTSRQRLQRRRLSHTLFVCLSFSFSPSLPLSPSLTLFYTLLAVV